MNDGRRPSSGEHLPRYASLQDYLGALRRRRVVIGAFALVGVIFGVAFAASREETYTATASLSFRDISQDLRALGNNALPETSPQTLAAVNAELIARPEVAEKVASDFGDELTTDELIGAIEAQVAARTGLVAIGATWDDPDVAALIANGFAESIRKIRSREIEARLEEVIESYTKQVERLASKRSQGAPFATATRISLLEGQISQLGTLQDIAEPVQIVNRASGASRNSFGTGSSGVVGGMIGLVLGLIAGFTRDALDRRVRNVHQLHRELGIPVLGRIPESAMGFPLVRRESRLPRLRPTAQLARNQRDGGRG